MKDHATKMRVGRERFKGELENDMILWERRQAGSTGLIVSRQI